MAREFRLPKLVEGGEAGTVAKVLVAPGETVAENQAVLEVETDKAVVEVPAQSAGRVTEVHVNVGDEATEGTLIYTYEATDQANEPVPVKTSAPASAVVPAPEPAAAAPIPAAVPAAAPAPFAAAAPRPAPAPALPGRLVPAAPSVRRLARELGVEIAEVQGSGPEGRISADDVKAYVKQQRAALRTGSPLPGTVPLPDLSQWGETRREPMSGVRRKTAEHLSQTWASVPQVTQFDEADITELERLRKLYAPKVEQAGGKLTMTAILLKVAAAALRAFPNFNTSVDMAAQELVYKQYYHIGVAVDTDRGLLVPVIRDVDRKNLTQLSVELHEVAAKARDRRLTLADMQGGCFTISNLGGIGGTAFTPIVNAPEVAILGVARGRMQPKYNGQGFEPRLMLPLCLSYDHRVIDGADGARFLRWLVEALENPFVLALEG